MRIFSALFSLTRQRSPPRPIPQPTRNYYGTYRTPVYNFQRAPPTPVRWNSSSWATKVNSFFASPFGKINKMGFFNKFAFPPLAFYSTHTQHTHHTGSAIPSPKYKATLDALRHHKIVPDVVDEFMPSVDLKVAFPKGDVKDGNIFTASDLHYVEPDVSWPVHHKSDLFTLVKIDPDAPSKGRNLAWRHWVVVNIPGKDIAKGEVLTPYMGPHPPKDSGLHRYVFLLYKQNDHINPPAMDNTGHNRADWDVRAFAKENDLGLPVGAAFYRAQY